jgi:hypothetical protein
MTTEVIEALRVGVKEVVQELYYPKVEKLVKSITGASKVIIFDHTVRKRDPEMKKEDNPSGKEQPATVVCIFFSSLSEFDENILTKFRYIVISKNSDSHDLFFATWNRSGKGALRRIKQNIGEAEDFKTVTKGRIRMIK